MIKSLIANNSTYANFASVAVQPASPTSVSHESQQQTSTTSHESSPGVVPIRQATLTLPTVILATEAASASRTTTLSNIVNLIQTDSNFIFKTPAYLNHIIPTFALDLNAGKTYDPRVTQGFVNTTKKFQPYESLTGISHERPELVMLTNFQPLFDHDVSHSSPSYIGAPPAPEHSHRSTSAGKYLNVQFQMRALGAVNVQQNVRTMKLRYQNVNLLLTKQEDVFTQAVTRLKEDASYLMNLIRIIETQKGQLDLRHDLYEVNPHEVAANIVSNFSSKRLSIRPGPSPHILNTLINVGNKEKFTCVDTLVDLGYTHDSVKNIFSSTKIWLQLCVELKAILRNHSLRFLDIDSSYQRKDDSASNIMQAPVKRFEVADNLPDLQTVDELIRLPVHSIAATINTLKPAWSSIYQNVFFKNEESRIAALAQLLSKEYRYSAGLSDPNVKQHLNKFYGYVVSDAGNLSMLDSVIGRFGNNITDLPATVDNTVASIAQQRTTTSGILTFETKYVEGDTGTLSPGGDFYFDRVMETDGNQFDTAAIDDLATHLQNHADNFNILCDSLNFLSLPVKTVQRRSNSGKDVDAHFLENATEIVYEMADRLINTQTATMQRTVVNDRLGAIFAQARRDSRVKTILFLHTLCRVSRAYSVNVPFLSSDLNNDNTPLVDNLIDQLNQALESTIPESRAVVQLVTQRGLDKARNTSSLTPDSIKHALKEGTAMTQLIEQFMSAVLAQFRVKTSAIKENYTRYSGILDTVVMMMAFDFAIATVARYSNQRLVGVHHGLSQFSAGQTTFAVSQTSTNHQASFNELTQLLSAEENITRQTVMTVLNTLQKLSGSLKGISNYLNSRESLDKLRQIGQTLKNDPQMMRMLLSEQQIMLLSSLAESLNAANNQRLNGRTSQDSKADTESDDKLTDEEVTLLDESALSPQIHAAVNGLFGTSDYAGQQGTNKRIMTVGIPLGFTQRLKQKINIQQQKRASFQNKQSDIVQVVVYKTDMQNADIVYKPIRFLFELSRFPTRFTTAHWLPLPPQPKLSDIINAIPTQCYMPSPDSNSPVMSGIEYASSALANSDGMRAARAAFSDPSYSFLSADQKAEILHNHVVSQLTEAYIKLMTGINVAEHTYHMTTPPAQVESDVIKALTTHTVSHLADRITKINLSTSLIESQPPTGGVLFNSTARRALTMVKNSATYALSNPAYSNPAGVAGSVSSSDSFMSAQSAAVLQRTLEQVKAPDDVNKGLDQLSHRHVSLLTSHLQAINSFSQSFSSLSSVDALNHRVLSPKQFDRVFNVIVDARDFEIDIEQTLKTPHGQQALDLLIKHGDVVPVDSTYGEAWNRRFRTARSLSADTVSGARGFIPGRVLGNVNRFKYRDRDKTQGDLIADKYFITIETFGEDTV